MAAVRPAQPVPTMTTFSTLADMGMRAPQRDNMAWSATPEINPVVGAGRRPIQAPPESGFCVENQGTGPSTPHPTVMLFFKRILGRPEPDDAERRADIRFAVGVKFPVKVILNTQGRDEMGQPLKSK